jgi:hypothetical protein
MCCIADEIDRIEYISFGVSTRKWWSLPIWCWESTHVMREIAILSLGSLVLKSRDGNISKCEIHCLGLLINPSFSRLCHWVSIKRFRNRMSKVTILSVILIHLRLGAQYVRSIITNYRVHLVCLCQHLGRSQVFV